LPWIRAGTNVQIHALKHRHRSFKTLVTLFRQYKLNIDYAHHWKLYRSPLKTWFMHQIFHEYTFFVKIRNQACSPLHYHFHFIICTRVVNMCVTKGMNERGPLKLLIGLQHRYHHRLHISSPLRYAVVWHHFMK